jgi:hypothetical protein
MNHLRNGTVLPHGLLECNPADFSRGFNSTYNNTALRVGMITNSYAYTDPKNLSKLTTEYDVAIIQQDANRGVAVVNYKNCMSSEGLGSKADFFERNLRKRTGYTTKGEPTNFKGQNGAIVLVLCLDALTEKALIIGSLTHPDRTTTLTDTGPLLTGQFNGVKISINEDGSCSLIFQGAMDTDGNIIDPTQGQTEIQITTDGSFQINHVNTTLRLDKSGVTTLTTTGDINATTTTGNLNVTVDKGDVNMTVSEGGVTVTALKDILITCQGTATLDGSLIKLGVSAVEAIIKGNTFQKIFDMHTHVGNLGFITSVPLQSAIPSLSKISFTE